MPIGSITLQPVADSLNAAYRPIVFRVTATATTGGTPPVVYCDIYINGTYYKSLQKTQVSSNGWQFDIQDACQEVLKPFIAPNGGTDIVPANSLIASVQCMFRSSGLDPVDGFITPEDTAPIQGTGSVPPTAGTGTASNTFYVVNATLQHDQNQDLEDHLASYKTGVWDANTWPMTHRINGYRIAPGTSDYFPIVTTGVPSCVIITYRNKNGSTGSLSQCGATSSCPMVGSIVITTTDNGNGTQSIHVSWGIPDPLLTTVTVQYTINGSGNPYSNHTVAASAQDTFITLPLGSYDFRLQANGACNTSTSSVQTVGVDPPDCVPLDFPGTPSIGDGNAGSPYDEIIVVDGTLPFIISAVTKPAWMTINVGPSTHLTGTPVSSDAGTGILVEFTLTNACGSETFSQTIDVTSGARFTTTTFVSGDTLNVVEIANLLGIAGSTVLITMDTLTNTNGGTVKVNGSASFAGNTWNVTLNGAGQGTLDVEINGTGTPGTSVIIAHFVISSVNVGSIGTPNSYQISKIFTN